MSTLRCGIPLAIAIEWIMVIDRLGEADGVVK